MERQRVRRKREQDNQPQDTCTSGDEGKEEEDRLLGGK